LYFMKASADTGRFQIYRSQFKDGAYLPPEQMPFSDEQWKNADPTVAPDESYLVFTSNRPPTAANDLDLFIVFRRDGKWGTPVHLDEPISSPTSEIEPRLAPDGRTLFFSSRRVVPAEFPKADGSKALSQMQSWNNGSQNIWRVDLSPWLGDLQTAGNSSCSVPY
jgi:hypothetical protein